MTNSKGAIDWRNFTGMETGRRVGDVVVLPITSFSPGVGQMGAGEVDDPMAFVKHDFEGKQKHGDPQPQKCFEHDGKLTFFLLPPQAHGNPRASDTLENSKKSNEQSFDLFGLILFRWRFR